MVASELSHDENRTKNIGYVTGMVQIGFGLGPIVGHFLLEQGTSYSGVFRVAAALSLFAAVVVFPLHHRSPVLAPRPVITDGPRLGPELAAVARSRAALPLLTILLCACLFTTMNSFQTTFSVTRGLSFNVFYVSYSISVIFARLVLARLFRDPGAPRIVAAASTGIVVSVLLFLVIGRSVAMYALASWMLGMTYGLTLPAMQAGAVNASAEEYRPRMLPLAGLIFEVAVLAFPLVAGAIITAAGYNVMFVVLLGFATAIAGLGIWQARAGQVIVPPAALVPSPASAESRGN
jgi:MFS family permease